jgi:PAS domain S-box-containing protein
MNDMANTSSKQSVYRGLPPNRGSAPSLMALRALTEQAIPDALFVHDHNGRLIEVNTIACELLGYTRKELLSMYVSDVDQDFDLRQGQALWLQLNEGERRAVESRHRHKDGRIFPVRINFGLFHYYGERLYIAVVQDLGKNQQHSAA